MRRQPLLVIAVGLCASSALFISCGRDIPVVDGSADTTSVVILTLPPLDYGPPVSFSKRVMPLLLDSCASCHNPRNRASGYDVTTYGGVMRGGKRGPAVISGSSKLSLLARAIAGRAIDFPRMPPEPAGPISYDDLMALKRWIDQGARND
ncbi:MAG: hypothetical protein COS95_02715 [Ignavibacteriales bacterium CG07_land_8_20_14_0_80_59_12]|nr:MAG: hypothetical protein COS95_02715 [Ignavibacteriales bacterium CG07_land_8_20_14_0_80_59_12]